MTTMRWGEFFGPGNRLRWEPLHQPEGSAALNALRPFLSLVEERAPVAALPRVSEAGARWYIGCREERGARFAQELIQAFLGRSYAKMNEPARLLEPKDAVERAFVDEFREGAFVVEVRPELREVARARLLTMARCLLTRPAREARRLRSVGRLLRDVEFAIQQADDASAALNIEELRLGGHLEASNIEYLTLRRLAARESWSEILTHPDLRRLLDVGPPRRAREAVIQAAYHELLCPGGVVPEAAELLRRLEMDVLPAFAPAFRSARGLVALEADASFALLGVLRAQPRDDSVDRAIRRLTTAGWADVATAIEAAWGLGHSDGATKAEDPAPQQGGVAAPAKLSWSEVASDAYNNDDVDLAYRVALQADHCRERAMMLVRCAQAMEDSNATLEALTAWEELTVEEARAASERGRMRDFVARLYERIGRAHGTEEAASGAMESAASSAPVPVDGWRTWFQRLRTILPWAGATSAADLGQRNWSADAVLADPEAVSAIVETIESTLPEWAVEAVRNSLPFLQEVFVTDAVDTRAAPIVAALFDVLATDGVHSLPSCEALIRLAQWRLSASVQTAQYGSTVDVVVGAVESIASPMSVPVLVSALEMLVGTPCTVPAVRENAAIRLLQCAVRWWKRIAAETRSLLRGLAADLNVGGVLTSADEPAQSEAAEENPWRYLANKYVAMYSLDEAALARASRTLQEACPSVRIATFAELVATASLQDAAKRADLFVIATKVATHAATTFIEKFMNTQRVAYATGKGSSSMLTAIRRWVDAKAEIA